MSSRWDENPRLWRGLETGTKGGRFFARVTCACCDAHFDFTASQRIGHESAIKQIQNRGWRVDFKKTRCPDCLKKIHERNVPMKPEIAKPEPVKSPSAKEAQRFAFLALEEYFDIAAGRYKSDRTDQSVAKEFGLSVEVMKRMRDEFFGPLKIPAEFADIEAQVRALEAALQDCAKRSADLNRRLAAICEKNGWK